MTETVTLDGFTKFTLRELRDIERCVALLTKAHLSPAQVAVVNLALTDHRRYAILMNCWVGEALSE